MARIALANIRIASTPDEPVDLLNPLTMQDDGG